MIGSQFELHRRTQHAVRRGATDDALLQHHVLARDVSAGKGEDRLHAGHRVGGAADHIDDLAGTGVDLADLQPVGIGVLFRRDDVADDKVLQPLALVLDTFDLETDHVQRVGDLVGRRVGFKVLLEPVKSELHL